MLKVSLRNKLLLGAVAIIVGFSLFQLTIFRGVLFSGFLNIETTDMTKDVQRVQSLIDQQVNYYSNKIADWSVWDDSYKFIQDRNQLFIDTNLLGETFKTLNINFMIFVASPGAILYSQGQDLKTGEPIPLPDDLKNYLLQANKATVHDSINSETHGIIRLSDGPFMFSSRPVVKSDNTGPIRGTIIFGKYLDKDYITYLSRLNNSHIEIEDYNSKSLDNNFETAKAALTTENKYLINTPLQNQINGYSIIYDTDKRPAYILKDQLPRPIYVQGSTAINFALGSYALVSMMGMFFALLAINKLVIARITKLSRNVDKVKDPANRELRLDIKGSDEFAKLADNFNNLLDDLEKYKLAIDNSLDIIVMTDANLKIVYINKIGLQRLGYTLEEVMGKTPGLWHEEADFANAKSVIVDQKKIFKTEVFIKRKNGEMFPVEVNVTPILNEKNEAKFYIGVEHDISSDKQLKENLIMENQQIAQKIQQQTTVIEEKEAELLGLINSISLGFIMFDAAGKILFTNPAVERITGLRLDGQNIDFVDNRIEEKFKLKEKFQKCLLEKQVIKDHGIEFNNRYLHLSVNPIFSSKELMTLIGVAVLIEDSTEAKLAERSKDEFFSIASHELRTPLTAIRGNTALLKSYREKLDTKEVEAMIDDINDASVRLIGIVNDFLDTSSLETGKMIYKKESLDLVDLAQKAIKEYQTTGSLKMLYLSFVPPATPIENVIGDKERVKQVLVNLVGNAVKYTDKGGVVVSVERDNGFIKVLVTDTGKGILQENQQGLFNKFHQGAKGEIYTRDVIHGSGLGLYISKMLVEGMGGKIALEKSAVGTGSTFSFELPMDTKVA
jgi:PAS domain S-box-containing protein